MHYYLLPDIGMHIGVRPLELKVYELDVIKGDQLKEINNLGDSTIFLGRGGASSIDSSKFT